MPSMSSVSGSMKQPNDWATGNWNCVAAMQFKVNTRTTKPNGIQAAWIFHRKQIHFQTLHIPLTPNQESFRIPSCRAACSSKASRMNKSAMMTLWSFSISYLLAAQAGRTSILKIAVAFAFLQGTNQMIARSIFAGTQNNSAMESGSGNRQIQGSSNLLKASMHRLSNHGQKLWFIRNFGNAFNFNTISRDSSTRQFKQQQALISRISAFWVAWHIQSPSKPLENLNSSSSTWLLQWNLSRQQVLVQRGNQQRIQILGRANDVSGLKAKVMWNSGDETSKNDFCNAMRSFSK